MRALSRASAASKPFLDDDLGRLRILFEILGQVVAHGRVDDALDLAVAQLGLGLALELRLGHAERDDGRQSLAAVVAAGDEVLVEVRLLAVGVDRAGDGGAEAGDVRAAFGRADVVHVGVDVLGELGGVLQGHFQAHALVVAGDVDDVFVGRLAGAVEMLDELDDAALVVERFAVAGAIVAEDDFHAAVEEGQLLQAAVEDVVLEVGVGEDQRIGLEGGLGAHLVGASDAADLGHGHAPLVFLLEDVSLAADFDLAPLGEEVDHGDAHAVQAAGGLIGPLLELPAELQHGHHALERGEAQVGMFFDGDAAAVVLDRHRAVVVDRDGDFRGIAGHRLVDRVVDHFIDEVVQAAGGRVGDVHARPLADVLQVAEVFQVLGAVVGVALGRLQAIGVQVGRRGGFLRIRHGMFFYEPIAFCLFEYSPRGSAGSRFLRRAEARPDFSATPVF